MWTICKQLLATIRILSICTNTSINSTSISANSTTKTPNFVRRTVSWSQQFLLAPTERGQHMNRKAPLQRQRISRIKGAPAFANPKEILKKFLARSAAQAGHTLIGILWKSYETAKNGKLKAELLFFLIPFWFHYWPHWKVCPKANLIKLFWIVVQWIGEIVYRKLFFIL